MLERDYPQPLFVCDNNCFYLSKRSRVVSDESDNCVIHFSDTQLKILDILRCNPDTIIDSFDIIDHLWSPDFVTAHQVDNLRGHILRLRQRLEILDPLLADKIVTYRAKGYMWARTEFIDRNTR